MYNQKNIEDLFELIGQIPGQVIEHGSHFDSIKTSNSIWPNELFNLKATENNLNTILTTIEDLSALKKIPNLLMCHPLQDNTFITETLIAKNYRRSIWTAMTHDLLNLPTLKTEEEFKIKLIKNIHDLELWLKIVKTELMDELEINHEIFQTLLKSNQCYFYLGIANDVPVSTSLLFHSQGSSGIYLVSTTSSYRRKGAGARMTQACLQKAKELNSKQVDLQATDSGKNMYSSLGFVSQGSIQVFRVEKALASS